MRSYYSYGIGFGQVLQQSGGSAMNLNLTGTTQAAGTTGGGTVLDRETLRRAQALIAQRTTQAVPTVTGFKLLTPTKRTTAAPQPDLVMAASQQAELTAPKIGSKVPPGGTAPSTGGGGASPALEAQFATACAEAGGSVVGSMRCQLPDGAIVTVDEQGNAVCTNTAGQCAGEAAAATGKTGSALMIGAAALAALMFLR